MTAPIAPEAPYLRGGIFGPDRLGPASDAHAARGLDVVRPPQIPPDLWRRAPWHARRRAAARHGTASPSWRTAALEALSELEELGARHVTHAPNGRNPR